MLSEIGRGQAEREREGACCCSLKLPVKHLLNVLTAVGSPTPTPLAGTLRVKQQLVANETWLMSGVAFVWALLNWHACVCARICKP